MKIAEADALFTFHGFRTLMVPRLVSMSLVFVGVAWISVSGQSDLFVKIAWLVGAFAFVFITQAIRYSMAGQRHRELKDRYGERYVALVEDGRIPIRPDAILWLNAPWSQAQKYIPEEGPYIPPPDRR